MLKTTVVYKKIRYGPPSPRRRKARVGPRESAGCPQPVLEGQVRRRQPLDVAPDGGAVRVTSARALGQAFEPRNIFSNNLKCFLVNFACFLNNILFFKSVKNLKVVISLQPRRILSNQKRTRPRFLAICPEMATKKEKLKMDACR